MDKKKFVPTPMEKGRARVNDWEEQLFLYMCEQEDASQSEMVRNAIRHYALTLGYLPDLLNENRRLRENLEDVHCRIIDLKKASIKVGLYQQSNRLAELENIVLGYLKYEDG